MYTTRADSTVIGRLCADILRAEAEEAKAAMYAQSLRTAACRAGIPVGTQVVVVKANGTKRRGVIASATWRDGVISYRIRPRVGGCHKGNSEISVNEGDVVSI